jgi:hypothetical protein
MLVPSIRRLSRSAAHASLGAVCFVTAACRSAALAFAPEKSPRVSVAPQATQAKAAFVAALEGGRYEQLPAVTDALTAAYLADPRDPTLALYVAHAHFWRVAERARDPDLKPTVTDHLLIAEGYFRQAQKLDPSDARIEGWLGGVELALGKLHADERWLRQGYFTLEDGVSAFPEFNEFSKSYSLSVLPRDSPRFAEALDAMWASVEACSARGIDHAKPDYRPYFLPSANAPRAGRERVCHNGPKAPHNFEGFFLHNGDLLVKAGQPAAAKLMYENARLEPSFAEWSFRELLEQRIRTAEERARAFAGSDPHGWPEMMVASRASCTGCHQR